MCSLYITIVNKRDKASVFDLIFSSFCIKAKGERKSLWEPTIHWTSAMRTNRYAMLPFASRQKEKEKVYGNQLYIELRLWEPIGMLCYLLYQGKRRKKEIFVTTLLKYVAQFPRFTSFARGDSFVAFSTSWKSDEKSPSKQYFVKSRTKDLYTNTSPPKFFGARSMCGCYFLKVMLCLHYDIQCFDIYLYVCFNI